jgi:hypothetical protein
VEIPWKKDMTLHCLAVGLPEPNVVWIFNGKEVSSGGKREVQKRILFLNYKKILPVILSFL